MEISTIDMLGRLLLATLLTGLIGFEREASQKAAGLRTFAMVGFGAAMFSIVSIVGFEGPDQSRIAAQIVTGIGFLGAGAIFRDENRVKGLTTAAGLWASAAIGMAIGSGQWALGTVGTAVALVVLLGLRKVDLAVARRTVAAPEQLAVSIDRVDRIAQIGKMAGRMHHSIDEIDFERRADGSGVLTIAVDPDRAQMITEMLQSMKGVIHVEKVPGPLGKHRRPARSDGKEESSP